MNTEKYLKIAYPEGVNVKYARLLAEYLRRRFVLGGRLLDVGAGTGDYTREFLRLGIRASPSSYDLRGSWNEKDESFDYIFCKSVLEHIVDTYHFLFETHRILKKQGRAIFLVPDWNSQWKTFYDDSTHVKPFTLKGLEQAFKLADFKHVYCEHFYQLPFTWRHKWAKWIPHIVCLLPDSTRYWSVHIRFSKEKMLLCIAQK